MSAPEELKAWREAKELSQTAAAEKARVSGATWCDWEQGNKVPTVDRAEDLEKLTDGAVTVAAWAEFSRDVREIREERKKSAADKGAA